MLHIIWLLKDIWIDNYNTKTSGKEMSFFWKGTELFLPALVRLRLRLLWI